MTVLSDQVRGKASEALGSLPAPVRLVLFVREADCKFCAQAKALATEVAALSDKISLEVYDLARDPARAVEFKVDRVPAFCIVGEKDYGIRYFGVPAGFEFTTLVSWIEAAGLRDSGLQPETRQKLAALATRADLQLFVTLSCPACPNATALAARLAIESDKVTVSVIDAAEFPELANLYDVTAVPKTIVNRGYSFQGVRPEGAFVEELLRGVSPLVMP